MSMFGHTFHKRIFVPKNPDKCYNCNGKMCEPSKIELRSSWEIILANYLDLNENVLEWGSEIIKIPYYSNIDHKQHQYVTDFVFTSRNKDGIVEKWLVEVKPENQVPKLNENGQIDFPKLFTKKNISQKKIDNWKEMCEVLTKNHEKWQAARAWARKYGYSFKIVTEEELGLKYQKK